MKRGTVGAFVLLLLLTMPAIAQRSIGAHAGFGRGGHFPGGGFGRHTPFGVPKFGPGPRFGPRAGVFIGHPGAGIVIHRPGFGISIRTWPRHFGVHPRRHFFPRSFPGSFCAHKPLACRGRFGFSPLYGPSSFYGGASIGYWPAYALPYAAYYAGTNDQEMQAALEQQRQVIADLEEQLRQERLRSMEADAAQPVPVPAAPPPPQRAEPPPTPTMLVFRDGNRIEVKNYAIMGDTLYEFAQHWTRKIALSDLDVETTIRANEERGVDFRVPSSNAQVITNP